jgi:serine/threonine protein kinase
MTSGAELKQQVGATTRTEEMKLLVPAKEVSYDFLVSSTQQFQTVLGEGAFATVYLGTLTGKKVAVKVEKTIDDLNDAKMSRLLIEQFESELETLYTHAHANICALVGHSEDGPSRALVYEFCANGALYDRIACAKGEEPLTWGQRIQLAVGAARGLAFLHSASPDPIVHRDVKVSRL